MVQLGIQRPETPPPWCSHPIRLLRPLGWVLCLTCGVSYDRQNVLDQLRSTIQARLKLPPLPKSPWSAEERANDPW